MAYFTVVLTFTENSELIDEWRSAHGKYLQEQVANGLVHIAGGFEDGTGGIIVAEVADKTELKRLLDNDPFARESAVVDTQIYPFRPTLGMLSG